MPEAAEREIMLGLVSASLLILSSYRSSVGINCQETCSAVATEPTLSVGIQYTVFQNITIEIKVLLSGSKVKVVNI